MRTEEARATLYIDIETIPGEEPNLDSIVPDARLKDPEKIAVDLVAKQEKQWTAQSFDPFVGEIFCIGVAVNDEEPFCIVDVDEEAVLRQFEKEMAKYSFPVIVGHNILEFDARWLFVKGLKYRLPSVVTLFSDSRIMRDTMRIMDGTAWKTMTSQDKMAKNFGLAGKGEVDGSMVWGLVKAGQGDKVCKYCCDDVSTLRKCFKELHSLGLR